ncbi:MAG: DNA repair protein RadA, partial [Acidobacteriota bacterium]|nr:DNA repair protein RadA [Acidobacteriota bacterium]
MKTPTHVCRSCGAPAARWSGRCARCGEWNSLETAVPATAPAGATLEVTSLDQALAEDPALLATGVAEFDRVLGGGLVAGSATLLFGEPGVGKSTLALAALAGSGVPALLCAAEESAPQVARRARRLGVRDSIDLVATGEAAGVAELVASGRWRLCGVDSISALGDGLAAAGSLAQVRAAA